MIHHVGTALIVFLVIVACLSLPGFDGDGTRTVFHFRRDDGLELTIRDCLVGDRARWFSFFVQKDGVVIADGPYLGDGPARRLTHDFIVKQYGGGRFLAVFPSKRPTKICIMVDCDSKAYYPGRGGDTGEELFAAIAALDGRKNLIFGEYSGTFDRVD